MRTLACLAAAAALAPAAYAQSVATMRLTADGQASVTVAPNTPVHLDGIVSWTLGPQTGGTGSQNTFAGIKGGILITDDAGSPANLTSHFTIGGLVNLGSFVGGSRPGIDIAVTPSMWGFIIPPSGNSAGLLIAGYDLTLADPGTYHVNWAPDPTWPLVRVYPSVTSFNFAEIPTTFHGATIVVIPAPATVAPVLLALVASARPRREHEGVGR
jgi:hypothetical protein